MFSKPLIELVDGSLLVVTEHFKPISKNGGVLTTLAISRRRWCIPAFTRVAFPYMGGVLMAPDKTKYLRFTMSSATFPRKLNRQPSH